MRLKSLRNVLKTTGNKDKFQIDWLLVKMCFNQFYFQVKEDPDDPKKKTFYMLWKTDDQIEGDDIRRIKDTIPAPKVRIFYT